MSVACVVGVAAVECASRSVVDSSITVERAFIANEINWITMEIGCDTDH